LAFNSPATPPRAYPRRTGDDHRDDAFLGAEIERSHRAICWRFGGLAEMAFSGITATTTG